MLNEMKSASGGWNRTLSVPWGKLAQRFERENSHTRSWIILVIMFVCLISESGFTQDITNTLGIGGVFKVKDLITDFLTLNQSNGQVNILKTLRLENTTNSTTGVIFKDADRFIHNYGTYNTFIGLYAGNFTLTTANYNTGIGHSSLYSLTTGDQNTALGYRALYLNTGGYYNTAVGYRSLYSNTDGYSNIAVGHRSLYSNSTGHHNLAVGDSSLYSNTSGNLNTAVGNKSLHSNTTGLANTSLGYYSLRFNTIGQSNIAIGYYSMSGNTEGNYNTALGASSLSGNIDGEYNTALGFGAGGSITTGSNLTCIGYDAEPTSASATNQITLGNNQITSLRCNVTTITSLSDARDKKNIKDLDFGIDFLMKIKPRQFNWDKREWYNNNMPIGSKMQEEPTAGFIAQELDETQTDAKAEWLNLVLKDNPEKWESTPGNLLPIMVKAMQELNLRSEELKAEKDIEIAKLKSENDELKKEVASLKSINEKLAALEQLVNEMTFNKQTSFSLINKKEE